MSDTDEYKEEYAAMAVCGAIQRAIADKFGFEKVGSYYKNRIDLDPQDNAVFWRSVYKELFGEDFK